MAYDVLLNRVATIERCVARASEEYRKDPATFATDFTRQDAAILNILRAYQGCLDMGNIIIRRERLGVPEKACDVFTMLAHAGCIDAGLAEVLKKMVGYCHIAVHDDQTLQLPITVAVLERHSGDFLAFSRAVLGRQA